MKENPAKAALFWAVVVFTVWAVYWNVGSVLMTVVAALLLLGALTSFFLPTNYTLDEKGAQMTRGFYKREIEWGRVRSVSVERDGVFLSPFPLKSRLENFRGMYLPFRGNKEEVLASIDRFAELKG